MNPIRILLADDEEELVVTLAERLEIRGFAVKWVTTVTAACDILRDHVFDVAVLDVKLPGMSGPDLKRRMARIAPQLKFIFMTGHGSADSFKECAAEAGSSYFLMKPINIDVLVQKIREIAGGPAT
jgi:DNA-binding NtrC family response regulator